MELTHVHLRYLLCIYELSLKTPDVSSAAVARRLSVKKPSVSAMLSFLMEKGLVEKQKYGKVYLTEQGHQIAYRVEENIQLLVRQIPVMGLELDEQETYAAACAMAAALPEKELCGTTSEISGVRSGPETEEKRQCGRFAWR